MRAIGTASMILLPMITIGCSRADRGASTDPTLFQKKVECEKYASKLLKEFRETGPVMPGGSGGDWYVERIFYSPKRDSCICIIGNRTVEKGEAVYDMQMIDALTTELLWSHRYKGGEVVGSADDIEAQVKRYE